MPEPDEGFAILAAVPLRHLRSGLEVCARQGRVALPATARGDLDAANPGEAVYLYAYQVGDRPVPAATWRATFVRAVRAVEGGHPEPDLTPPTWREERWPTGTAAGSELGRPAGNDDDDEPETVGAGPPAAFLEVEELRELEPRDWLFTNELVPKRDRGARTFVPLTPVRVPLPP